MKRSRRGGRRSQGGTNTHNNSGGNSFNPNRVYDSNGPEIKIRGTASHVYDKYLQLARDANASGDRVQAENYLQHAEHYFRIMAAMQAQVEAKQAAQAAQAAAQAEAKQAQPAPQPQQPEAAPTSEAKPARGRRSAPKPEVAAPAGVGEQPSLGNEASPSFSLGDSSSAGAEAKGEKAEAPVGE